MSDNQDALRCAEELEAYHTASNHKVAAAHIRRLVAENDGLYHTVAAQAKHIIELVEALREIEWSNDTTWQRDRARAALAKWEASNGS